MDLLNRYSRQTVLPQIGKAGQEILAKSRVLVIGCGALGSIQSELLARAGVGFIRIVDRDIPEWSNLPRQFLYEEQDVVDQKPKALAAAEHLRKINSTIVIEAIVRDVTPFNIESLMDGINLVLDGVDNFETRYLLNDACVKHGIPWIYGGIQGLGVIAMPVIPTKGPCLQCVFPEAPPQGSIPTCDVAGVLNTAPAIAASLQVTQAIRILIQGMVEPVQLLQVDPWNFKVTAMQAAIDPDCVCCGKRNFAFLSATSHSRSASLCGRDAVQISPATATTISLHAFAERLRQHGKVILRQAVLEFEVDAFRLVVFSDGRTVVHGTRDFAKARSLVAQYLGL